MPRVKSLPYMNVNGHKTTPYKVIVKRGLHKVNEGAVIESVPRSDSMVEIL